MMTIDYEIKLAKVRGILKFVDGRLDCFCPINYDRETLVAIDSAAMEFRAAIEEREINSTPRNGAKP